MKSSYKKLGPYIQPVDIRNLEDRKDNLLGVSTNKVFIPSVANTVGTDFTKYKKVKRGQFTYVPDTSRRGDRIGIAMLDSEDEAIVSQAYTVFEVKDHDQLLPEYLMMWFRRPEFDRYARFKSHGSVREIFDWEEMCDVELPIPHIDKQREIVKEYHTIVDRIALNEELNRKLEETAQAIYKQWFVDFEFPVSKEYAAEIGRPELEGKPYKSSGGEMVWNEELEKEIPVGWEDGNFGEFACFSQGIQVEVDEQFSQKENGLQRFLRIVDYTSQINEPPRYVNINDKKYYCNLNDIAMIRYGSITTGKVVRRLEGIIANNLFKISPVSPLDNGFCYYFLSNTDTQKTIENSFVSSTMPAITHTTIKKLPIVVPAKNLLSNFKKVDSIIEKCILIKNKELESLKILKDTLLSKMTKVETTI